MKGEKEKVKSDEEQSNCGIVLCRVVWMDVPEHETIGDAPWL